MLVSKKASFTLFQKDAALRLHNNALTRAATEAEMVMKGADTWCHENNLTLHDAKTET